LAFHYPPGFNGGFFGVRGGFERYIGTRYHFNDTYREIMKREAAIPRIYPATKNGEVDGEPVLLTREELNDKRRKQGSFVFGCQMLQNPIADAVQGFKREWMKFYKTKMDGTGMNIYILVDPANEKKKESDYTAMFVVGLAADQNTYILEEHIESKMEDENYRFAITPLGGSMAKNDRIRRLIPDFQNGNIYFPLTLTYVDYEGTSWDLVQVFIDAEYIAFPVGEHEDMFDALARIKDMTTKYPLSKPKVHSPIPSLKRFGHTARRA